MKFSKFSKFSYFEILKIIFLQEKKCFFDSDFFSVLEIISRIDCTQKIHYIRGLDHYIPTIYYFVTTACYCQITIFICIYAYTPGGGICSFLRKKGYMQLFVYAAFQRFSRGYMQLFCEKRNLWDCFGGVFRENMD